MAEYKSLPAGDLPITAPFRMNSGIDSRVIEAISSYTFCVTVSSDDPGMKKYMKAVATAPSAKAIGMPEHMTTMVATPYKAPMARGVRRQPRHGQADGHHRVRNPQRSPEGG